MNRITRIVGATLSCVGILALAGVLTGIVWDAAWEGRPAGTELASDLDLFIQEFKDEVADRDSVEHIFGVGSDDNGLARLGSARSFIQNAAPTDLNGPGQYNSTAGAFGGTPLGDEELGASVVDQGTGRFWVDADGLSAATTLDDNQLNVWVDTVGWVAATATSPIRAMGSNLIYNGSFEITDGTGSVASTAVPSGWALLLTPTLAYDDPTAVTEGEGIALETIGAGAALEGVQQTLTSLKASTAYLVRARARPVTAADTCTLRVTGGAVTPLTDVSAVATNVFETLEVVVTTTAVPAALVVSLEATADTDECDWDHVTAFEQNALVAQPGIQSCRVTEGTVSANYYNDAGWTTVGTTCTITVPNPGMMIVARGTVLADEDNAAADGSFVVRMQENINGGGAATVALGAESVRILTLMSVDVGFSRVNPAVGSTFVYTLDGQTDVGGGLDRNWDGAEAQGETPFSVLEVTLTPTR